MPAFKIGLWNAWLFMSIFVLQMGAIMLANKRIRKRSHVPAEARTNALERSIGIVGNSIWFLALGYSVFLPLQSGTLWFYLGLAIFLAGSAMLVVATVNFLRTPHDRLITQGVYGISRHPMYVSTFFICLGSGVSAASWMFVMLALILALCLYQEALVEERYCLNSYGPVYETYMRRIPRWLGAPRTLN